MNRYRWLGGLVLIVVMGMIVFTAKRSKWNGTSDFRLGIVEDDGLSMISISPQRRMVNKVRVDGRTNIWLPGGMGWYQAGKVEKIMVLEKKPELVERLFFYNFGFWPDKIVTIKDGNWEKQTNLINLWGWYGWLRYKWRQSDFIYKEELIKEEFVDQAEATIDEIAPRDLADSDILSDDLRLRIYNASSFNGLGAFMARRIEWAGYFVISIENSKAIKDSCRVFGNSTTGKNRNLMKIISWWSCDYTEDGGLLDNEVEIYFGEELGEVLKYLSYKQSL